MSEATEKAAEIPAQPQAETPAITPAEAPVADPQVPAPVPETKPAEPAEPTQTNEPSNSTEAAKPATSTEEATPAPALPSEGWPALDADHPLSKFLAKLPTILKDADYNEVYGVTLEPSGSFGTKLILQKFLRANANDLPKAEEQLTKTLKWRKEFQPLKAKDETFSATKFGGLGWITTIADVPGSENKTDVVTFNIYGAVKSNKETFGGLEAFMRWRVALMEKSVEALGLTEAAKPIPDYGKGADPYQGFQVHDYMNVSFLRQDPLVKKASGEAIKVFGDYYPETMSRKFFVSVPLFMSWMFTAMKVFISKETQKKFQVMTYATSLAADLGPGVPEAYGGKAGPLDQIGRAVKTE